jgi:nicotinamidase-related amidase
MKHKPGVAVILMDVINAFEFPGAAPLIRAAKRAAPKIDALVRAARAADVPVIYVNDNFGHWKSDFRATVTECTNPKHAGHIVSEQLRPTKSDYFVLKPQHSGFYGTPLDMLLDHLGAHTLVIAGFATNLCVLFTANDAHMRGFHLVVPRDGVAANSPALTRGALAHVRDALSGETPAASSIDFAGMRGRQRKFRGQTF